MGDKPVLADFGLIWNCVCNILSADGFFSGGHFVDERRTE